MINLIKRIRIKYHDIMLKFHTREASIHKMMYSKLRNEYFSKQEDKQ